MEGNSQLSFPEEDEDLEALRLAALQSLKRKAHNEGGQFGGVRDKVTYFNGSVRGKHKRGKFSRLQQGRACRNGQFNGWTRNSNLIAVPMVQEADNLPENKKSSAEDVPKLVLPQHRYCKSEEKSPEKNDATSKFDRYNDSDESESDSEEETELTRSSSLEALMAELENEIQGVTPIEQPKPKPKKKRKVVPPPEPSVKENLQPEVAEPPKKPAFPRQRKWQGKPRPRHISPTFPVHHAPPPELIQPVVPFVPPPIQSFQPYNPIYVPPVVYETPPPPLAPIHVAPPIYDTPVSPLSINTDAYSTSTMAPLSPRSAAFVMENRAIIEKRKRRSYSRSPTPVRFRRSKSPKRSSLSPKRLSKSPKRRSLSLSPVRRVISPKKPPIHDRLGAKTNESEDPILEARRKKFERNEITMTEGVIRLKKPEDETKKEEEEIDEDALLEGDDSLELDPKIDVLFSDEESDSDNEGRFKTKQEATNQKVPILPFTKLTNGMKGEVVKADLKLEEKRNEGVAKRRKRFRSRTPLKRIKKVKLTPAAPLPPERKIEIKIRNPAKYEKVEEDKTEEGEEAGDLRTQLSRKRAERQKNPLPDVVPSRLLQNALQGVGFRKGKNSVKDDTEGKLPIHLRLGAANGPEVFGKKSRKHKKGSQEQV